MQPQEDELTSWLCGQLHSRILVIAAHPDDETIGLGARLQKLHGARYVIVTDGAPANLDSAREAGFATRSDYARARRAEFNRVMSLCAVPQSFLFIMGLVDQHVTFNLIELAQRLSKIFADVHPELVITHPYEGGHPDHDAVAFAVHAARRISEHSGGRRPRLVEMTSYHANDGKMEVGVFLPQPGCYPTIFNLSEQERRAKQELLDCYETQRKTLANFRTDIEQFRFAPEYNFTRPPHDGRLFYDYFDWGITSAHWRQLASAALMAVERRCL
jgi:LmbE family N-acetylglucosaminyl deacetylase